jgi:hypothetical protein
VEEKLPIIFNLKKKPILIAPPEEVAVLSKKKVFFKYAPFKETSLHGILGSHLTFWSSNPTFTKLYFEIYPNE